MTIGVVGGGPSGILTASLLASEGFSVKLFQSGELGGSHRVDWVDGYFSEHGPRGYSSFYKNYIQILKHLGLDFFKLHSDGGPQNTVFKFLGYVGYFNFKELINEFY